MVSTRTSLRAFKVAERGARLKDCHFADKLAIPAGGEDILFFVKKFYHIHLTMYDDK